MQYMLYIYNIYAVMKTMCPTGYQHNDFVATQALDLYVSVKETTNNNGNFKS